MRGRTTAFKFSLLFTLASSFVTGISMYTLYRSAEKEIREQIDSRLLAETTSLRRRFEEGVKSAERALARLRRSARPDSPR